MCTNSKCKFIIKIVSLYVCSAYSDYKSICMSVFFFGISQYFTLFWFTSEKIFNIDTGMNKIPQYRHYTGIANL